MVLLAAGAVAAAVLLASVVVYFVTRNELIGQIDLSLRQKPQSVQFHHVFSAPELAKLRREGKLPPGGATRQVGLAFGDSAPVGGSASVTALAPARR
jgi:hypothetical protein